MIACEVCGEVAEQEFMYDGVIPVLPPGWSVYVVAGKRRHRCSECRAEFAF